MGLCKDRGNLKVYLILQPIMIVIQFIISITNAFGFNGFIRSSYLFTWGKVFAAILAITVSIIFMSCGIFSSFIYFKIVRRKEELTSDV